MPKRERERNAKVTVGEDTRLIYMVNSSNSKNSMRVKSGKNAKIWRFVGIQIIQFGSMGTVMRFISLEYSQIREISINCIIIKITEKLKYLCAFLFPAFIFAFDEVFFSFVYLCWNPFFFSFFPWGEERTVCTSGVEYFNKNRTTTKKKSEEKKERVPSERVIYFKMLIISLRCECFSSCMKVCNDWMCIRACEMHHKCANKNPRRKKIVEENKTIFVIQILREFYFTFNKFSFRVE